ncbi:hypothetical protein [Brockia lithotrophica]|uniref:Uncharacterized protein n=2 Tax=Brockia lithotrophica TaxID=933949 RepID=A0A660LBK0_9BACL|nr:hypothetical protein [Brockia lithotrophica]RKQ88980.1 hypothetical protein C7438_0633 [Brockia lithotrophica]
MIRRLMSLDRKVWIKVWIAVILLALLVVSGGVAFTLQPFRDKHVDDAARQEDLTASIAASEEVQPAKNPLPPGVEEPYCDCLADKLRPPEDWLPTRYSKSMWATRKLPTEEEIKEYRETKRHTEPKTSEEMLMSDLVNDDGYRTPDYYVTRDFRDRVDLESAGGLRDVYYDNKTYYDRIRFEYLGPEYYKGPIPGSRIEEAFMERYAVSKADNPKAFRPEFQPKLDGRSLAEKPDAYDAESGLLWDELIPSAQDMSGLDFLRAGFANVILLDYKLDENGHLKEFIFRPIGRREAFRVTITPPIESFIENHFWGGWNTLDINTIATIRANKENEQYLQDLIRYRQPVYIHLNKDFKRKLPETNVISWKGHEEYIRIFDPEDNKIVREVTYSRAGNPNSFVLTYTGGDFVFELSAGAFGLSRVRVPATESYPDIIAQRMKENPDPNELKKIENDLNNVWSSRKTDADEVVYVYKYSLRDRLVALAPPFTGLKEYHGPVNNPDADRPEWKKDPKEFVRHWGWRF